ncbi:DUF5776 domain-containing protein [Lentilactobacillus senioris]|uniref:DUF5776 domain-containing protein n=1 Tax=Lentilactobacillus senioris TaxID=931534 RepID=UPI0022814124|nr:DUF5776 domain-containing protein [Lentilactobacillus senioris]MCY9806017.1 DUF5776 domain-containing protein [Lentilactobacillus senioris]
MQRQGLKKSLLLVPVTLLLMGITSYQKLDTKLGIKDNGEVAAATTQHADTDVVAFEDPYLESDIEEDFLREPGHIKGQITYGELRHYSGDRLSVRNTTTGGMDSTFSSLEGIQALKELPANVKLDLHLGLDPAVSMTPLQGLKNIVRFGITQDSMHKNMTDQDFAALNSLEFTEDTYYPTLRLDAFQYYRNQLGLTSGDLVKLQPMLKKFATVNQTHTAAGYIDLTGQAIKDYSVLNGNVIQGTIILAIGQFLNYLGDDDLWLYADDKLPVAERKVVVKPGTKGLNGEPIQNSTRDSLLGSDNAAYRNDNISDGSGTAEKTISQIEDKTEMVVLAQYDSGANPTKSIKYADGTELQEDGVEYYKLIWGEKPKPTPDPEPKPDPTPTPTPDPVPTPEPEPKPDPTPTPDPKPSPQPNLPNPGPDLAQKRQVVYTTNNIYLYRQPTFTQKARKLFYAKKGRMNRPMFVVIGYARSNRGLVRYKVRDVNRNSKTFGQTGYITTKTSRVVPVYYRAQPKYVMVINASGVNAYCQKNLTGKVANYRQGTQLRVVELVEHNLTTRFKLSNGKYITANKKLVYAGKHSRVTKIKAKTPINRYQTVNLTNRLQHYSRGTYLKVNGYVYSHPNELHRHDALRYQVKGGYITGNNKLVNKYK